MKYSVMIPFSDEDITRIFNSLSDTSKTLNINGVILKKRGVYYKSRTGNATVRLVMMLINGRIYHGSSNCLDSRIGKLLENPAEFIGAYVFSPLGLDSNEFALMAGEPSYRASADLRGEQDFLYLCAITQLYTSTIRMT